jgi:hypothetical protein
MGVADGLAQALVELAGMEDDFAVVHGLYRRERHLELAAVLDANLA